ncbi:hypothetical protein RFN28_32605 [Mesorhizobium sp. VK24D]|uniref:SAM-dependent methyltransferase n=1 Tax=Mesorhizobium album TaxID=3072314 RepID=A0ABU4YA04_9HYPH|nr:hypothetical protein [Mesorhizobium sp. VK24D]MDX8483158.1 hypothetical protein [Mesorhizobium sp. VK24D]
MSKRSRGKYPRASRDFYATPLKSVLPLVPHLRAHGVRDFAEPCCGEGDLVRHLEASGFRCTLASDIATRQDALDIATFDAPVVTNPPYSLLLPLVEHFIAAAPSAWLLLMADVAHNRYFRPLAPNCSDIVSAGRACWFGGGGTENIAWFRFSRDHRTGPIFHNGEPRHGLTLICAACGKTFRPIRRDQKFCAAACRQRAYRDRLFVTNPSPYAPDAFDDRGS